MSSTVDYFSSTGTSDYPISSSSAGPTEGTTSAPFTSVSAAQCLQFIYLVWVYFIAYVGMGYSTYYYPYIISALIDFVPEECGGTGGAAGSDSVILGLNSALSLLSIMQQKDEGYSNPGILIQGSSGYQSPGSSIQPPIVYPPSYSSYGQPSDPLSSLGLGDIGLSSSGILGRKRREVEDSNKEVQQSINLEIFGNKIFKRETNAKQKNDEKSPKKKKGKKGISERKKARMEKRKDQRKVSRNTERKNKRVKKGNKTGNGVNERKQRRKKSRQRRKMKRQQRKRMLLEKTIDPKDVNRIRGQFLKGKKKLQIKDKFLKSLEFPYDVTGKLGKKFMSMVEKKTVSRLPDLCEQAKIQPERTMKDCKSRARKINERIQKRRNKRKNKMKNNGSIKRNNKGKTKKAIKKYKLFNGNFSFK